MTGNNMFYVYILFSQKDKKLYTGFTNNLKERLQRHCYGLVSSTKNRRPLILIYYEAFTNKKDAIIKEKYYKSGPGRKYLQKHLKETFIQYKNKPR